jgi:hypothetical protein
LASADLVVHELHQFLVFCKFVHAVRHEYQVAVLWRQLEMPDVRLGYESYLRRNDVSKGACHGQSWDIFIREPYTERANGGPIVTEGAYAALRQEHNAEGLLPTHEARGDQKVQAHIDIIRQTHSNSFLTIMSLRSYEKCRLLVPHNSSVPESIKRHLIVPFPISGPFSLLPTETPSPTDFVQILAWQRT